MHTTKFVLDDGTEGAVVHNADFSGEARIVLTKMTRPVTQYVSSMNGSVVSEVSVPAGIFKAVAHAALSEEEG